MTVYGRGGRPRRSGRPRPRLYDDAMYGRQPARIASVVSSGVLPVATVVNWPFSFRRGIYVELAPSQVTQRPSTDQQKSCIYCGVGNGGCIYVGRAGFLKLMNTRCSSRM